MTTISDYQITPVVSRNIATLVQSRIQAGVPETLQKMQALKLNPKDLRSQHIAARNDVKCRSLHRSMGGDTRQRLREKLQKA